MTTQMWSGWVSNVPRGSLAATLRSVLATDGGRNGIVDSRGSSAAPGAVEHGHLDLAALMPRWVAGEPSCGSLAGRRRGCRSGGS